jgi:hypothetical protein
MEPLRGSGFSLMSIISIDEIAPRFLNNNKCSIRMNLGEVPKIIGMNN